MRVLVVVGTRPEAIKMAPILEALRREDALESRLLVTGQHTDLVGSVLESFGLDADDDLEIMTEGQSLYDVAERCLRGVRDVVDRADPDLMLVQGDTATVLFASMVGYFEKIRIGHVEAGLRSHDKWSPFPEEMFRRLSDDLADLHLAPTRSAAENLRAEGTDSDNVYVTGNPVVDALERMPLRSEDVEHPVVRDLVGGSRRYVLITVHRRESFGEPIRRAFTAIRSLADAHPDVDFLYPVHPNPRVQDAAREILSGHDRIRLTAPLDYGDFLYALSEASITLTDSGGIQEEAPSFGTPVLVLREVTERPEGVAAGVARLVGTDPEKIVGEASRLLDDEDTRQGMIQDVNPYGDGRAGERIADIAASVLTGRRRRTSDWAEARDRGLTQDLSGATEP